MFSLTSFAVPNIYGRSGKAAPGGSFVFLIGKGNASRHFVADAACVADRSHRRWAASRGRRGSPASAHCQPVADALSFRPANGRTFRSAHCLPACVRASSRRFGKVALLLIEYDAGTHRTPKALPATAGRQTRNLLRTSPSYLTDADAALGVPSGVGWAWAWE